MSELLELAAKAMHHRQHPDFMNYTVHEDGVTLDLGSRRGAITSHWNPLTDDGDAFRLMAELSLSCAVTRRYCKAYVSGKQHASLIGAGLDRPAAMRISIVRAAAEIGRAL